jgi:hypothetical protein
MKTIQWILLPILSTAYAALSAASPSSENRAEDHLFLDNGTVKIGIHRTKGAAITWLSWTANPTNCVNHSDPGRLIQQSYYAGKILDRKAEGQHPAWSPWNWNPIQGGGVGSWARVTTLRHQDQSTISSETIPRLWDMPQEEAQAIMRQWTSFEPCMSNVIVVRCEFISQRQENDRWGPPVPSPQEVPACYFTRKFSRFCSYLGAGKWREEHHPPGPPWGKATPPRKAMACFAASGQGIAIFSPAATKPWNFGPHGQGTSDDPSVGPCVHIAPIDRVPMGPRSIYRYRYWLIVGTEPQITQSLDALWEKHSHEKAVLE